jgi:hypothetical protein
MFEVPRSATRAVAARMSADRDRRTRLSPVTP